MPRYIDAEVLRTEINGLRISGLGNKPPEWHDAMWKCLNVIIETPTADVRKRIHGHWGFSGRTNIYGGVEVTCSNCKNTLMVQDIEREHFCRNCGADMREW